MIFSGCKNNDVSNINPILKGFTCDFEILKTDVSGTLSVDKDGYIIFEFEYPNNLYGTKIEVGQDSVTITTLGITKTYNKDDIPHDSVPILLFDVINCAEKEQIKSIKNEAVIQGIINDNCYTLSLSENGYLSKLEFQNSDNILVLKNAKLYSQ